MLIRFTKRASSDTIEVTRADGSGAQFSFPHKGPTPHDAYHLAIEGELGLARGFWGLVASGMDPADVGALAAAGGHASAKRAGVPDAGIVELLQAERLVECFEAESWSASEDDDGIRLMAEAGWSASHVPPLPLDGAVLARIRQAIRGFAREWAAIPQGSTLERRWPLG
jgi:hypothetical protein